MCRNTGIKFLSWAYMYTCMHTTLTFLGKHMSETNSSKFDERLFSDERERERERGGGGGKEEEDFDNVYSDTHFVFSGQCDF